MRNWPPVPACSLKKGSTTKRTETTEKSTSAFLWDLCDLRGDVLFCDFLCVLCDCAMN